MKYKFIINGIEKEYKEKDIYVVGDVHGCYYTLKKLLRKIPKHTLIIFVGDLCDKGKYTDKVIELVLKSDRMLWVKGNHEQFMQLLMKRVLSGEKVNHTWITDTGWGGKRTVKRYTKHPELVEKHLEAIANLPVYLEFGKYFLTHGFGLPYWSRRENPKYHKALLSNRIDATEYKDDWENYKKYKVINIFGHCTFKEVKTNKNNSYYGLDTGCVYGNKLTAMRLKTMKTIQVKTCKKDIK